MKKEKNIKQGKWFIADNIYRQHFYLIIGSREYTNNIVKKWGMQFPEKSDGGFFANENRHIIFIWVTDIETKFSDLLHEICHLCVYAFDRIGMNIDVETTEAFAYYYQYIYNKVYSKLKNLNI